MVPAFVLLLGLPQKTAVATSLAIIVPTAIAATTQNTKLVDWKVFAGASVGAVVASWIIGLPAAALLLAFAPGGVEVMAAIAVETGLEPALVAAHHVFRLLVLTVLVPVMIARARRGGIGPLGSS